MHDPEEEPSGPRLYSWASRDPPPLAAVIRFKVKHNLQTSYSEAEL